jgi:hypothetical protein
MELFELRREVDDTGISGTGTVAQGVIFDTGWCALTWLTKHTSCAFYISIDEVIKIHGHDGKTKIVIIAKYDAKKVRQLRQNVMQDHCENIAVDFTKKNHKYVWDEREEFCTLFDDEVLNSIETVRKIMSS